MNAREKLFYALGQLAYSVAFADGQVQEKEKVVFQQYMDEAFKENEWWADFSKIIFHILTNDKMPIDITYPWAINEIRKYKNYLTPELQKKFLSVLKQVAESYAGVSDKEQEIIEKFEQDLLTLNK